ncbi:hypothetical protein NDU88_002752 [Pleurodeles waltl]|uniref:Uncharacterized protein n=1 Tax=Pleurodeles waltl TaxID=8319 RepID=A0AAV7RAW5_PLEWA|nr:hypothetical protein NDU88_002752 [Pleurodeles waltl]
MEPNKVVEALRTLQQEGREDLIKEGVLEQAWVGLKRPKRSSAEGVSAAILACTSPAGSPRKSKKFRAKSVSGRKVSVSPERVLRENELRVDLPGGRSCRRGEIKVPRQSGASFRQREAALGRGSYQVAAVRGLEQVVAQDLGPRASPVRAERQSGKLAVAAHVLGRRRVARSRAQQAQLALESEGSAPASLKERTLGGAANMAAASGFSINSESNEDLQSVVVREVGEDQFCEDAVIVIDSDDDLEKGNEFNGEGCSQSLPVSVRLPVQGGRPVQWIPRQVSPMVHRVQEWEVSNQSVLRAGEQVEFVDEQGTVIRGTICGAAVDDGTGGSAQVRLDFWQQGERAYHPGCDVAHALGGHEAAAAGQRPGRPAVFHRPVEVRAPSGHQAEERAQLGAVRLTSREVSVSGEGSSASNASGLRSLPASQGALSGMICEEEALDYEEDDTNRPTTVTKASSSKRAVPGDRLAGGENVLSGNLVRGEVANALGAVGAVSGKRVVGDNLNNVDVAIQVEDVGVQAGKIESLSDAIDSVAGAVKRLGGLEGLAQTREDAVQFIMQQIELGLSAVTISRNIEQSPGGAFQLPDVTSSNVIPEVEKENRRSKEAVASQEAKVEESGEEKENECRITASDRTEGAASRTTQSESSSRRDRTDTRASHVPIGTWLTQTGSTKRGLNVLTNSPFKSLNAYLTGVPRLAVHRNLRLSH